MTPLAMLAKDLEAWGAGLTAIVAGLTGLFVLGRKVAKALNVTQAPIGIVVVDVVDVDVEVLVEVLVVVGAAVVVLVVVDVDVDVEVLVLVVDVEVVLVVLVEQQGTNVPLPIIVELPAGNIKEPTKASIVTEVPKLTTSVVHTQTPVGIY